jgi:hypothetical protein
MTDHDPQRRQRGSMDQDERGPGGPVGDQRRSNDADSSIQDRGEYGGLASGEGQGEFAGDGYSAQGQFTNQRVAQYGDQGYAEDYGRQGIGWQNRQDDEDQASEQGVGSEQSQSRYPSASNETKSGATTS